MQLLPYYQVKEKTSIFRVLKVPQTRIGINFFRSVELTTPRADFHRIFLKKSSQTLPRADCLFFCSKNFRQRQPSSGHARRTEPLTRRGKMEAQTGKDEKSCPSLRADFATRQGPRLHQSQKLSGSFRRSHAGGGRVEAWQGGQSRAGIKNSSQKDSVLRMNFINSLQNASLLRSQASWEKRARENLPCAQPMKKVHKQMQTRLIPSAKKLLCPVGHGFLGGQFSKLIRKTVNHRSV